jgi:CheY-like chemotaxis protein
MVTLAIADIGDVVSWLESIEQFVGRLYTSAAKAFAHDNQFSSFLTRLAEDEQSHAEFMSMVSAYLREKEKRFMLDIALDRKTRDRVEGPLKRFENHLAGKSISKRRVVEYMARAESSELNPVFLYIVGKFGEMDREAERMTAEIQSHLSRIRDYINVLPQDLKPSVDVEMLPAVWEERFLIVEDHEPLRELVTSLLSRRGTVEAVAGGGDGLEKVREHFYNGIVSDIQMPGMDGFEFYQRAVECDPKLKKHFLFYSADITPEREAYLKKNKLSFLRKPFALGEFMDTIEQLLRQ